MPTLPLEKDGQQRIMRDMWLEGDIEDSLLALAKELGWLKDLAKYSKVMAPLSRRKLQLSLAADDSNDCCSEGAAGGASAGGKTPKSSSSDEKERLKHKKKKKAKAAEGDCSQKANEEAVKAVARLILSGKCRRVVFVTGNGCSASAGAVAASELILHTHTPLLSPISASLQPQQQSHTHATRTLR